LRISQGEINVNDKIEKNKINKKRDSRLASNLSKHNNISNHEHSLSVSTWNDQRKPNLLNLKLSINK